jgi:LysR family pca operon transcriptional activator
VIFCVRAGHPLHEQGPGVFTELERYPVLMPTRASIIRPFVERYLIANGISGLPTQIETVSDSFGRAFVRATDAIWIISAGVVATDLADGTLAALPIDTSETKGPVGLTVRADSVPSMPLDLLMRTIRDVAAEITSA